MDQINIPDSLNLPWEKHSEMRKQDSSSDSLDVNAKRNHDLTLYSQTGKAGCSNFTLKKTMKQACSKRVCQKFLTLPS